MPGTNFLPTRQAVLAQWTADFSDLINATPGEYGLDMAQATAYATLQTAYAEALDVATNRVTRSPANIEKKNTAKDALVAETRKLVDIIQAWPDMTNDKRSALGITLRDNTPTPAPVPSAAPAVAVASVEGRLFNLRLRDINSSGRAKPAGVRAAWLYTFVGENMPTFEEMTFRGSATRTDTKIVVPADVAVGSKVWISACWVNTADKPGPVSMPIFSWTNHGAMQNNAA